MLVFSLDFFKQARYKHRLRQQNEILYDMAFVKQQLFTFRIARVHSSLELGVKQIKRTERKHGLIVENK